MLNPRLVSVASLALLLVVCHVHPADSQPPNVAHSGVSLRCVLLKNDNVLFGHAHQVGELVIVRTGQGGEIQLPRTQVACWADSTRDLYRYRIDHRQTGDLSAHLRDAEWCLRYELYDLVADELREIRRLDPHNTQADLIEERLRRRSKPRAAEQASSSASRSNLHLAGFQETTGGGGEIAKADVPTLRSFARHVQPMLLNRCGRCHGHKDDSKPTPRWTLRLPPAGARASSRITRENLAASMPYVDFVNTLQSPLLVKATTAHGGESAPLDVRNAKAIESLKLWLAMASRALNQPPTTANHGFADTQNVSPTAIETPIPIVAERPPVAQAGDLGGAALTAPGTPGLMPFGVGPERNHDSSRRRAGPAANSGQPARLPRVANPFDPDLFNRRFHLNPDPSTK